MKKIFLFAGEQSGDLYGEELLKALKRTLPSIYCYGVGGPKMRRAGLNPLLKMEQFQVMGFMDVFLAFPRLLRHFFFLKKHLLSHPPDVILLIDYPGFNLALAKNLRKKGFKGKICHYICPSVWAWGKKRIPKMEAILDELFVIFPFEKDLFNAKKLNVHFVGHPLTHKISSSQIAPINIDPQKKVIAIFPGSRVKELHRNFPMQLKIIKALSKKYSDLVFIVSIAQPRFSLILDQMIREEGFLSQDQIILIDATQNEALMKRANLAIAKSGTNNLELALFKVPSVVTYGIGPIDLLIAKNLLKIDLTHYSIANIVASERIFPELIGPNLTEKALLKEVDHFLSDPSTLEEIRKKCLKIGTILQDKQPEIEIAEILKNLLNEKKPS